MVVGDGEGILPIDFGRAFTSPYTTLTEYLETVQHERTGGWLNLRESIKDAITRDELTREEVREWITEWTIGMQQALLGNWDSIVKDAELLHNSGGVVLSSADLALLRELQRKRKTKMEERLDHVVNLDLSQFIEELINV